MIRESRLEGVELNEGLNRPLCPGCHTARIRPVDISGGTRLEFECSSPGCQWRGWSDLPRIKKTVIYLDTSTISHIAAARRGKDERSPWLDLFEVLRRSVADEVVACARSPVTREEMELSKHFDSIVDADRKIGCVKLKHELEVRQSQVFRALDRYLDSSPPAFEFAPPIKDAFREDPHRWLPVFQIDVHTPAPAELIKSRRSSKASCLESIEDVYRRYAEEKLDFEEIQKRESRGFGRAIFQIGMRSIACRLGLWRPSNDLELAGWIMPGTFDAIVYHLRRKLDLGLEDAISKAAEFLAGDHVAMTPLADLGAKLNAGLAMACRGPTARSPRASDQGDIDHLATFVPYVDVIIADRFFATLCNQQPIHLGKPYGTKIRSLGDKEVPEFIEWLHGLSSACPHRQLSLRIKAAIRDGGYHAEMKERLRLFLKSRGIEV